jgi:hypothetical protein
MTENNGMFNMPVMPAYTGGYGGDMFGGNSAWWIIILLIFGGWGWGGNGWGNGGMNGGVGSEVQRGFDQSAVMNGINGINGSITSGFGNVQTALCNGFAGVNAGIANGFAQAEIAANARQMADMNQQFALQSALQSCCCENRMATADLKYTVATEACADRNAIASALRDVLEANNASTQKILDTMCQDKIDAKNETIAQLRQQLQMAQLSASQGAQTAQILANNEAQTAALEQYLAPVPRPAYIVQNPNCCSQNWNGCGCGA